MDLLESLGVKIPNALLVSGFPDYDTEEIEDFLSQYGDIDRSLPINSPDSEFHNMLIVEFKSGSAFESLEPLLPYTFKPDENEYCIKKLSKVYASNVGRSKTKNLLTDLKNVARLSGQDFTQVLKELMTQINETVTEMQPGEPEGLKKENVTTEENKMASSSTTNKMAATTAPPLHNYSVGASASTATHFTASTETQPNISEADINPPGFRKFVVEHLVKSDEINFRSSHRLRMFSGRTPRPQHEVDYDTWRSGVDLILKDPAISDLQGSRHILDSLLPPAADIVKHLSLDLPMEIYIQHLDSAYGTVQDGEELYVKFMDTLQDSGEKPSAYLQRLQVALSHAVKRGGVKPSDVNRHLLSQFCRGCWDNGLIAELQLKQRKSNPPSFAELLLLLRTEEDREASKTLRMKQHLGTSKQRVAAQAQVQFATEEEKGVSAVLSALTKQMADIQKQLAALTASQSRQSCTPIPKQQYNPRTPPAVNSSSSGPKPGFCFRCGEDGHIRPQCKNSPNPALVTAKRKQFSEKKPKWQTRNPASNGHLN